jgi:hypothetical protein
MEPKKTEIKIRNFQSIESLDLSFSGFTCVTGPTNIGKSAIIRAISSALLNKAVVGSVRKGKKFCTVEVDGLKWEKGESIGRYWVPGETDGAGNPVPRDKVGQGQTEITQNIGYRAVKVGDKYITPWHASQFNPVFLMDQSGPAVTDFISDIAHLKVLQDAIVHCTRNRSRLLSSLKEKEEELARLEAKEQALSGLDNLLRVEKDLVAQADSLEEYAKSIARLRELIVRQEADEARLERLSAASSIKVPKPLPDPADSLMPAARLWQEMESTALRLSSVKKVAKLEVPDPPDASGIDSLRRRAELLAIPSLRASVSALDAVDGIRVPDAPESHWARLTSGLRLLVQIEAVRSRIDSISDIEVPEEKTFPISSISRGISLMREMEEARGRLRDLEEYAEHVDGQIEAVSLELAAIPKCPTCDQVWVSSAHSHA